MSNALGGELSGETELYCGVIQNWAVLTSDSLMGLMRPSWCAVD